MTQHIVIIYQTWLYHCISTQQDTTQHFINTKQHNKTQNSIVIYETIL